MAETDWMWKHLRRAEGRVEPRDKAYPKNSPQGFLADDHMAWCSTIIAIQRMIVSIATGSEVVRVPSPSVTTYPSVLSRGSTTSA